MTASPETLKRRNRRLAASQRITCAKKQAYPNKKTAKRRAADFRGPNSVKPYECPICGFYHLTSKRENNERSERI